MAVVRTSAIGGFGADAPPKKRSKRGRASSRPTCASPISLKQMARLSSDKPATNPRAPVLSTIQDRDQDCHWQTPPPNSLIDGKLRPGQPKGSTLSRERLLLIQAHNVVELETNWLGHRPCIMDIILDARVTLTVAVDSRRINTSYKDVTSAAVWEAGELCQRMLKSQQSVYWDDLTTALSSSLAGGSLTELDLGRPTCKFAVSSERSTLTRMRIHD